MANLESRRNALALRTSYGSLRDRYTNLLIENQRIIDAALRKRAMDAARIK